MTEGLQSPSGGNHADLGARGGKARQGFGVTRALLFTGLLIASAGVAYAASRGAFTRSPVDPTTERIRSLIDEANRLLKELDDKRPG